MSRNVENLLMAMKEQKEETGEAAGHVVEVQEMLINESWHVIN